jgi:hypothetical protein
MQTLVFIVAVSLLVGVAMGDTPLPPPSEVTASSPSGRIRAISEPNAGTRVEDVRQHRVLWRLPDWHRSFFVADDGKHLVAQYDGLNLVPIDFADDLVLFTFYREGRKIREITVRDFVPDLRMHQQTMGSHYYWGQVESIDAQGRLKVHRADGKTFFFDVTTGNETKT